MPKIKRNKKDKKLRQSIEVLKAQLKIDESPKTLKTEIPEKKVESRHIDTKVIKKDLLKTIVLSVCAFAVILTLSILNINPF